MTEFEQTNLAVGLEQEELDEIGSCVVAGFKLDWDSRAEWLENNQMWIGLVNQAIQKKSFPWDDAANIKYPLVAISALQFQSRVMPLLLGSGNLVRGRIMGFDADGTKADKSVRIGKHMTWQLLVKMENWQEEMARLLIIVPIVGTAFKKTYFDPVLERNESCLVQAEDLVVNYHATSLEKAPRITHVIQEFEDMVESKVRMKYYLGNPTGSEEELENKQPNATPPPEVQIASSSRDLRVGLKAPGTADHTRPRTILEQITRYDLDEDGYAEPLVITVDYATKQVLRIAPCYALNKVKVNEDGDILHIEPSQYYTKFGFIPSPDSAIYDMGFGQLNGPLNESINSLINQLLDAGTLHNLQAGFFGRGIKLPKGQHPLKPGEFRQISTSVEDLSKSIMMLPTKEPSATLFNLLSFLVDAGRQVGMAVDVLVGENPGQNQPATTTMSVLENGLAVFGAIYKNIHLAFGKELKKLFALNSEFLDQVEYFAVLDPGAEVGAEIARSDYDLDSFDVVPSADPTVVSSTQKLLKLAALDQDLAMGTINREEYTKRKLEALEIPNPDKIFQPIQPSEDPKITIRKMDIEWEREKWQGEAGIRASQVQTEGTKDLAVAQLALAKAQSEEVNRTLSTIQAQIDALMKVANMGLPKQPKEGASAQTGATEASMTPNEGETSVGGNVGI